MISSYHSFTSCRQLTITVIIKSVERQIGRQMNNVTLMAHSHFLHSSNYTEYTDMVPALAKGQHRKTRPDKRDDDGGFEEQH